MFFVADLVLKLLNKNVDVNCKDRDGRSPLWYAVNCHCDFYTNSSGECIYLFTGQCGNFSLVKLLLLRGALLHTCQGSRHEPGQYQLLCSLLHAVRKGYITLETVILNAVKQMIDILSERDVIDWVIRNDTLWILVSAHENCFEQFKILFSLSTIIHSTPLS